MILLLSPNPPPRRTIVARYGIDKGTITKLLKLNSEVAMRTRSRQIVVNAGTDAEFASRALGAARRVGPVGRSRLGDKVLISHAHAQLETPMPLDKFKQRLTAINGDHGLILAREDMPGAHPDPAALAASEVRIGRSSYHYIRVGKLGGQ